MFDMSWGEVMVIGAVALIVIGPKDLPKALRTVGQMTSKIRRMASEFQTQFNDAMREAELDDVKKDLQGLNSTVSSFNPIQTVREELRNAIESKPAATAPAHAAPVAETPPGESPPPENLPAATPPTEMPPAATPPTETPPAEKPAPVAAAEPELPLPAPEPAAPAASEPFPPARSAHG